MVPLEFESPRLRRVVVRGRPGQRLAVNASGTPADAAVAPAAKASADNAVPSSPSAAQRPATATAQPIAAHPSSFPNQHADGVAAATP